MHNTQVARIAEVYILAAMTNLQLEQRVLNSLSGPTLQNRSGHFNLRQIKLQSLVLNDPSKECK